MEGKFNILDYTDRLKVYKQGNTETRYYCPVCNHTLSVNKNGKWKCWSGCDNYDVKKAIAPEIYKTRFPKINCFPKTKKKKIIPLEKKLTINYLSKPKSFERCLSGRRRIWWEPSPKCGRLLRLTNM